MGNIHLKYEQGHNHVWDPGLYKMKKVSCILEFIHCSPHIDEMWFRSCFTLLLSWLLPLTQIECALNCELKYSISPMLLLLLLLLLLFKSAIEKIKTTHLALPQSYDWLSSLGMTDCPWLKIFLFINPKLKYIPAAFLLNIEIFPFMNHHMNDN